MNLEKLAKFDGFLIWRSQFEVKITRETKKKIRFSHNYLSGMCLCVPHMCDVCRLFGECKCMRATFLSADIICHVMENYRPTKFEKCSMENVMIIHVGHRFGNKFDIRLATANIFSFRGKVLAKYNAHNQLS